MENKSDAQKGLRPVFILPVRDELAFLEDYTLEQINAIWEATKPKLIPKKAAVIITGT